MDNSVPGEAVPMIELSQVEMYIHELKLHQALAVTDSLMKQFVLQDYCCNKQSLEVVHSSIIYQRVR